jgi:hypothetical protein
MHRFNMDVNLNKVHPFGLRSKVGEGFVGTDL